MPECNAEWGMCQIGDCLRRLVAGIDEGAMVFSSRVDSVELHIVSVTKRVAPVQSRRWFRRMLLFR